MTNPPAPPVHHPARRAQARERGSLLIWAAIVSMMILGVITAGMGSEAAQDRSSRMEAASGGQARAVALAGLVDAYAWFRRQQSQPVTNFAPVRNLVAVPPVNETDNATLGLVREYEILPSLWGRYEVRKTVVAEPYVDANGNGRHDSGEIFTDVDGNGHWDPARETRDVTAQRGLAGAGAVWLIESRGFLYDRPRTDLPLGTPPNNLRSSVRVASEIRRMTITPPAAAAVCAKTASSVTIGSRGRLRGGLGAGLAYGSGTGLPSLLTGSEVVGVPPSTSVPGYAGTINSVFSVSTAELKSMADVSTSTMTSVPSPVGDYTLTVIDGNATFSATQPLRGTGVMVVLGNCTINAGSNSYFSGLLWVQGTLTVRAPSYIRGVTIVEGTADIRGTGGDSAEIEYDTGVLNDLLFLMGQYRHSKAVFVPGGDPGAIPAGGP
jgi:hypothetical protein